MDRGRPTVCHLTTVHNPFDHRVFEKECITLVSAGYDVTLIAVHARDECVRGVRILGLPTPPNRLQRMVATRAALLHRAREAKADVYHFHDPELLPTGMALAADGHRVIYDVHEDVPRDLRERHYMPWGFSHAVGAAVGALEAHAARRLSAIVAATPFIGSRFRRYTRSVEVIRNYPSLHDFDLPRHARRSARQSYIAYAGSIDKSRGLLPLIDALELVNQSQRVTLLLAGRFFPSTFRDVLAARPGWRFVEEAGPLSRAALRDFLARASAGIVLGEPNPNMYHGISNKLFEYMASGLAVVASDFPEWSAVVHDARCGVSVATLAPNDIATAIRRLLADPTETEAMGRRGRAAIEHVYNWDTQAGLLLQLYDRILRPA